MMRKTALLLTLACLFSAPAWAVEKAWSGSGDGSGWFDDANWSPSAVPAALDDVVINSPNALARISQAFEARSLQLGGTVPSSLTVDQITSGVFAPVTPEETAIENRRDGIMILKGSSGTVVLRGRYKDSEEAQASQPSLVFFVE